MTLISADSELLLLGPIAGFYPVEGIEKPEEPQLWIPNTLQDYEARCLAKQIQEAGEDPELVLCLARGGMIVGQAIAYSNGIKPLVSIQTAGWTNDATQDEVTIIKNFPHVSDDMKGKRVFIADELADSASALKLTVEWAGENLDPADIKTGVIYLKDRDRVMMPDYYVRTVPNLWLDHESQSTHERRARRIAELIAYGWAKDIEEAMGKLAMTPVDRNFLVESVAASERHRRFDFSVVPRLVEYLAA